VYVLFFGKKRARKENKSYEELMVECAACGTFVSAGEAIKKDGKYFCSQKCVKVKNDNYRA
jgi:uncharacterized protein